jgi:hypothetical protein
VLLLAAAGRLHASDLAVMLGQNWLSQAWLPPRTPG